MTTIGITGHINLSTATRAMVATEIATHLTTIRDSAVGLTSLAGGADQIFADEVLAVGGSVIFVQPCQNIEASFSANDLTGYQRLRALASSTVEMPYSEPSEEAYDEAGRYVADHCDLLLAVWDGKPAGGRGGTADIVDHRRASGRPLIVIWPEGSSRG